jgi:aquaporin Z
MTEYHEVPSIRFQGDSPGDGRFPIQSAEQRLLEMIRVFDDPRQEWRRLVAELFGTFLLVMVAAGGGMMNVAFPGSVGRAAAVVAPGLMLMVVILFMGKVSGAHLNPAATIGFALRGDFRWRRVPGYLIVQLIGAVLAAWFLQAVLDVSARHGSTYPAPTSSSLDAFLLETVLTMGLVSVILGTASGAQQVGLFGALGVGGYVALAGLWASPLSGASMNPARTFGPDVVAADFSHLWVYLAGPLVGSVLAVGMAWILRGPGGGRTGSLTAQGTFNPEILRPEKE